MGVCHWNHWNWNNRSPVICWTDFPLKLTIWRCQRKPQWYSPYSPRLRAGVNISLKHPAKGLESWIQRCHKKSLSKSYTGTRPFKDFVQRNGFFFMMSLHSDYVDLAMWFVSDKLGFVWRDTRIGGETTWHPNPLMASGYFLICGPRLIRAYSVNSTIGTYLKMSSVVYF